jgi:hypothetical protein
MSKKTMFIRLLLMGVAAAPLALYIRIFGTEVSTDHTRWAEFGTAIGGMYSPLLAFLTLAVLAQQVRLQAQMNVHASDQAYLQQAREDIEFYCTQMMEAVNKTALPGKTFRVLLHESFKPESSSELDTVELRQLAANIHAHMPPVFDFWASIYPILTGLDAGKADMYVMTHASSVQKMIALLSFETCVALDNFHRVRSEGRAQHKYLFSPLLRAD